VYHLPAQDQQSEGTAVPTIPQDYILEKEKLYLLQINHELCFLGNKKCTGLTPLEISSEGTRWRERL
jgi:hypothetical protein